jgi:hypothetical protein
LLGLLSCEEIWCQLVMVDIPPALERTVSINSPPNVPFSKINNSHSLSIPLVDHVSR